MVQKGQLKNKWIHPNRVGFYSAFNFEHLPNDLRIYLMDIIMRIREEARKSDCRIVFPESGDVRILKAASFLENEKICRATLIGNPDTIRRSVIAEHIDLPDTIEYINPEEDKALADYIERFYERRKIKGVTKEQAGETIRQPVFFAASLVADGRVDGCVAGAVHTTGAVLKAAILIIGLRPGSEIVSSVFLMTMPDGRVFTYGDCAVVPYPDARQLSCIAIDSARTHRQLTGENPSVAMLSFSTKGSASHERVTLVQEATQMVRESAPGLLIDGELQADAALVSEVALGKAPGSPVAGNANVLIFPNLDAGNIAYKLTERLAGAIATGPIIQGLSRPMNDLSRGCSWQDVVNTAAVCSVLAR